MSKTKYRGHGSTFEAAFEAATERALAGVDMAGADMMSVVRVTAMEALYGGIAGHMGTRVVEVAVDVPGIHPLMGGDAAEAGELLALKLQVVPSTLWANLMPPVRRPQPMQVGFILTVTNVGRETFKGEASDSAVATFAVLRGRTTIWQGPQITMPVITPVAIEPGQAVTYGIVWDVDDVVDLLRADLTAVARFVPTGDTVHEKVEVKAAF